MVEIVFLIPLVTGALAFFLPRPAARHLLMLTGAVHLPLSISLWVRQPQALFEEYFAVTPEGLLSLLVISLLFFLISIYQPEFDIFSFSDPSEYPNNPRDQI